MTQVWWWYGIGAFLVLSGAVCFVRAIFLASR